MPIFCLICMHTWEWICGYFFKYASLGVALYLRWMHLNYIKLLIENLREYIKDCIIYLSEFNLEYVIIISWYLVSKNRVFE